MALWMSRKKEEKNQPYTYADGWSSTWMVVSVAIDTVDVKKERRKNKPTFYACRRVVVSAAVGTVDVKKERKKKKKNQSFAHADGWSSTQMVMSVVVGTMDVKKERRKNQPFMHADGWSSTRMDVLVAVGGDGQWW